MTFQLAEVAVPRQMFQDILLLIARLRATAHPSMRGTAHQMRLTVGKVRLDADKSA